MKSDISEWFDMGLSSKSEYMIVVCDTFSYEYYPVFCTNSVDCLEKYEKHNGQDMQVVKEVYDFRLDKTEQLNSFRAFNLPRRSI